MLLPSPPPSPRRRPLSPLSPPHLHRHHALGLAAAAETAAAVVAAAESAAAAAAAAAVGPSRTATPSTLRVTIAASAELGDV